MVVVQSHQQVLPYWAELRRRSLAPFRLITLDFHTDTSLPFRKHSHSEQQRLREFLRFEDPQQINLATRELSNDEHIQAALDCGILESAFVIAHNARDTEIEIFQKHRIQCFSVGRNPQIKKVGREECDRVLESEFLSEAAAFFDARLAALGLSGLTQVPYILDIDLDYLATRASAQPKDSSVIQSWSKSAALVTCAMEPDYVRAVSLDRGLTSEELLGHLRLVLGTLEELGDGPRSGRTP